MQREKDMASLELPARVISKQWASDCSRVDSSTKVTDRNHSRSLSSANRWLANIGPTKIPWAGVSRKAVDENTHVLRIEGIVSDVREFGLEANARPTVYVHYLQRPGQASSFSIVA